MIKRRVVPMVLVALMMVVGLVVVLVPFVTDPPKIQYTPTEIHSINYNNYIDSACWRRFSIDYSGKRFAVARNHWLGVGPRGCSIVDSEGQSISLRGVGAPIQLCEEGVVFLKNKKLFFRDSKLGKDQKIADAAEEFMVCNGQVIYQTSVMIDSKIDQRLEQLYVYDISKGESRWLYEADIVSFCIYRGNLLVIKQPESVGYINDVLEVSLQDGSSRKIGELVKESSPFSAMTQGDNLVLYHDDELRIKELNTGKTEIVSFETEESAHRIRHICDEERIFVSVQAVKYNGSIVTQAESENTGVWRVDPETLEKEKIVSEAFEELYLFEGNALFGIKNGAAYRIDIETKQAVKIAG